MTDTSTSLSGEICFESSVQEKHPVWRISDLFNKVTVWVSPPHPLQKKFRISWTKFCPSSRLQNNPGPLQLRKGNQESEENWLPPKGLTTQPAQGRGLTCVCTDVCSCLSVHFVLKYCAPTVNPFPDKSSEKNGVSDVEETNYLLEPQVQLGESDPRHLFWKLFWKLSLCSSRFIVPFVCFVVKVYNGDSLFPNRQDLRTGEMGSSYFSRVFGPRCSHAVCSAADQVRRTKQIPVVAQEPSK